MEWRRVVVGGKDTPKARAGHAATIVAGSLGSTMLIFGGKNDKTYFNDLFILDFSKDFSNYRLLVTFSSNSND